MNGFYDKKIKPHLNQIEMLSICGKSEKDIADFLGISLVTLKKYANKYPEVRKNLEAGKNSAGLVMNAFLKRACGYTVQEESCEFKGKKNADGVLEDEQVIKKTVKKDVPPDLNAIKWWLENNGAVKEDTSFIDLEEARELLLERQRIIEENNRENQ